MKIIHIEPNPEHALLVRLAITELQDVEIDVVENLAGFGQSFNPVEHQAVLSAYMLPDGHGTDLLRVLQESGQGTPFIIVSDSIDEKIAVELLSLGATDYVFKNNLEKLPIVLSRAMKEAHQQEQIRLLGLSMHDMMSPITAVSGYSDLLVHQISDVDGSETYVIEPEKRDKIVRYTDIIRSGIGDISAILDQLRSISKQRLNLQTDFLAVDTNLVWVTREVCDLMRGSTYKRHHKLEFVEPDDPVYACIDMGYFKRILYNFISNAIRYSPAQSSIVVSVKLIGTEAVVSVKDEGIGVHHEHHSQIFHMYKTVNKHDLENKKSTGLGLYINSILAQKLGGRITLESEVGNGSTFHLVLPATVIEL